MSKHSATLAATLLLATTGWLTSAQAQTVSSGPYYARPAWDQTLNCGASNACPRFIVLSNMNGKAVLDRETGLTWMRDAFDTTGGDQSGTWHLAVQNCDGSHWGTGRLGWRLPSVAEMTSLLVVAPSFVGLPAGHPFAIPASLMETVYWTSTDATNPVDPSLAKVVVIGNGQVASRAKSDVAGIWCVRGAD